MMLNIYKKTKTKKIIFTALVLVLLSGLLFFSCEDTNGNAGVLPPAIKTQPANALWNVFVEEKIDLSVTASNQSGLSYQWYKSESDSATGGTAIGEAHGGKSESLTLERVDFPLNGSYYFYVTLTNSEGSVTSNATCVRVIGNLDPGYAVAANWTALERDWETKGNKFTINATALSVVWGVDNEHFSGTLTGDIVGHREKTAERSGFITIKMANDHFYVFFYKDLSPERVNITGAWKEGSPEFGAGGTGGKTSQAEAEAMYTLSDGFFDWGFAVPIDHPFTGVWTDDSGALLLTLTGTTISLEAEDMSGGFTDEGNINFILFAGELVEYNADANPGYFVFKYEYIQEELLDMLSMFGIDLIDTYAVLIFKDYDEDTDSVTFAADWLVFTLPMYLFFEGILPPVTIDEAVELYADGTLFEFYDETDGPFFHRMIRMP